LGVGLFGAGYQGLKAADIRAAGRESRESVFTVEMKKRLSGEGNTQEPEEKRESRYRFIFCRSLSREPPNRLNSSSVKDHTAPPA